MSPCSAALLTPRAPGAIAIIQLHGDVIPVLAALTGRRDWPVGAAALARLGPVDSGIVTRPAPDVAQVMSHGGVRVIEDLLGVLASHGAELAERDRDTYRTVYPEARSDAQARSLALLARAESPLAIDLLLRHLDDPDFELPPMLQRRPLVVATGPPDVGKSTLMNALLGRDVAIAHAGAGTTRDAVIGRLDCGGLVVDWVDTPGVRGSDDPIEVEAMARARPLVRDADLLVAVTDHVSAWAPLPAPGTADLRVQTKSDLGRRDDADVHVCALTRDGLVMLVTRVRDALLHAADPTDDGVTGP